MAARLLPPLVLVVIAVTTLVGRALEAGGTELGTPLPPFLFGIDPKYVASWTALAVVALAGAVALAPWLARALRPPAAFALGLFVLALGLRAAVGSIRFGPEGMDDVFSESFESKNEYHQAFPALGDGVGFFLDRFAELVPALPVHVAGHPPGFLLLAEGLGLRTPGELVWLILVTGAAGVPLTYLLARRVLDDDRARVAGLLGAFACATTLFGPSAADVTFTALGALAAWLLLHPRAAVAATAGAAALALGSTFSYALLAIGAWAAIVRLVRHGLRDAVVVAGACGVALVVLWTAAYAATGFALVDTIRITADVYANSVARDRPYLFWLVGSPAAFLAFLGLPITWYAAKALALRDTVAVALGIVIAISAFGGFTKAETERIWTMYAPLACVAAAAVLPRRRLPLVLALLAVQTLVVELRYGTVW